MPPVCWVHFPLKKIPLKIWREIRLLITLGLYLLWQYFGRKSKTVSMQWLPQNFSFRMWNKEEFWTLLDHDQWIGSMNIIMTLTDQSCSHVATMWKAFGWCKTLCGTLQARLTKCLQKAKYGHWILLLATFIRLSEKRKWNLIAQN